VGGLLRAWSWCAHLLKRHLAAPDGHIPEEDIGVVELRGMGAWVVGRAGQEPVFKPAG